MLKYSTITIILFILVFFSCYNDLEFISESDGIIVQKRSLTDCNSSLQLDVKTTTLAKPVFFSETSSQRLPGSWRQREIEASHVTESTSGEMWGVVQESINPEFSVDQVFDIPGCVIQ